MSPQRSVAAVVVPAALHVLGGLVGLFVAFFVAYAFQEEATARLHATFLVGSALVALVTTAVATVAVRGLVDRWGTSFRLAASTAMVAYGAALGLGTLVSLLSEGAGSVTADQPDLPFVVLVAGCAAVVVLGARILRRALSRDA